MLWIIIIVQYQIMTPLNKTVDEKIDALIIIINIMTQLNKTVDDRW